MKKMLKNINNEEFEYEIVNPSGGGISVVEPGYIITPGGEIIAVPKGEDHNTVFSNYINKYLVNKIQKIYQSTEGALVLSKINHVVYYGIRMNDLGNIYNNGGSTEGLGLLILPENYLENITNFQKEAIKLLLATNKSIFGNREKIKIEIHEGFHEDELNIENFKLFLNSEKELERK